MAAWKVERLRGVGDGVGRRVTKVGGCTGWVAAWKVNGVVGGLVGREGVGTKVSVSLGSLTLVSVMGFCIWATELWRSL